MKKLFSLILVLIVLFSLGCAQAQPKRYQAEFLTLFDTVTTVVGYAESEEEFRKLAEELKSELAKYHQLYDIYHDYEGVSNIKTVNDSAGIAPVQVDGRIIGMLLFAKEQYAKTDGAVNVALGSVLKIWHDYRQAGVNDPEQAELPPLELLQEASEHTDINKVIIDEAASTVFLEDPRMRLDVGAVAKGYAVEQVMRDFESRGVASLLLSVGGNVRAIGDKLIPGDNGEARWKIGIEKPDGSNSEELMYLMIDGLSVVSSGNSERYYTVEGQKYHHIIDPQTLFPSAYFTQVTILCRDSGLGDTLSTAVFNMPLAAGRDFIESLEGVEAAWVLKDGALEYSSGFEQYLE